MSNLEPSDLPLDPSPRGGAPVSLVWIVPLVALVVALFIAWRSISSRGPLIEIEFASAEGITAGSTVLRYKDVDVGVVEDVTFTPGLQSVLVAVRLDGDIAPYVDEDAQFWVVAPRVTARGVSGLNTVLSGVYLEGSWDSVQGNPQERFTGQREAPFLSDGAEGLQIVLRAPEAGRIQVGAPVVYRGIDVGYIDAPQLTPEGDAVTARAVVLAPYDALVTTGTRFWSASGFSVNVGIEGVSLDVASLAALLEGGVAFDEVVPNGAMVESGAVFDVFGSRQAARENAVNVPAEGDVPFTVYFEGSIAGLAAGAAVEFNGLRVGSVTGIALAAEQADRTRMRVDIALAPERIGLAPEATPEEVEAFVADQVAAGLRARLASQGLLSSTLKVELVTVADAPAATLTVDGVPAPAIPATAPAISDVAESARGVLARIQDLPVEELLQNASQTLASLNAVLGSEEVQRAPGAAVALLDEARTLLASEEIRTAIDEAAASVGDVRAILQQVNESDALPALLAALARADAIAANIEGASGRLPDLVDRVGEVATQVAEVQFAALGDAASGVIARIETLIASEEIAALPQTLGAALANLEAASGDIRALSAEIAASGSVEAVLEALSRAGGIVDSVQAGTANLPALVAELETLAANAAALPLDDLSASAAALLDTANGIAGSEAARALPEQLSAALAGLTATLADVQAITSRVSAGPELNALMAALERSESIARSIDESTAGLPAILTQIEAVTAQAANLPLDQLAASATGVLSSADALLAAEGTQALPGALTAALDQATAALADVEIVTRRLVEGPELDALLAALARTDSIARSVDESAAGLPALLDDISALAARAEALPLEDLVQSSNDLVRSADALVSSEDTAQIPAALAQALDEVGAALAELREGGVVANANATLQSASDAADAIAEAAAGLPALAAELDRLIVTSEQVLATYGDRSDFNAQTLGALRDLRDAARAVTSLARTIERKPNSLLIGR